jgi:hypothetical protein
MTVFHCKLCVYIIELVALYMSCYRFYNPPS